jgi:hypothetical protein
MAVPAAFSLGLVRLPLLGYGDEWDPDDEPGCGVIIAVLVVIAIIVGLIFLVVALTS